MAQSPDEAHGCSSYPLSFPSEPPDIKNWFPSYEYESLEAPEPIGDSGNGESSEAGEPLEHLEAETEDANLASPENGIGNGSEHEIFAGGDLVRGKRKQSLRELFGLDVVDGCREDGSDGRVLPSAGRDYCESPEHGVGFAVDSNGIGLADTEENRDDEADRGELPMRFSEHKELEECVTMDGFVSIKSKEKLREEAEGGRERPMLQENYGNLEREVRDRGGTGSPLGDRTNFMGEAAAPRLEFCGKWKCPRKSKPYIGPPLKQMRLEQWVHRMK